MAGGITTLPLTRAACILQYLSITARGHTCSRAGGRGASKGTLMGSSQVWGTRVYPYPLGAGVCETKSKNGRSTPETLVSGVAPANQTKERAKKEKFMNFAHFCEFWCFSLGKQARFTSNFCSAMPPGKVHELAFLWFGLSGRLLILFLGFSVLKGRLRPWSQTMVSEGARPWGRGRSGDCDKYGEHPGDHNHQDFLKSAAIQMGGVLQYKWDSNHGGRKQARNHSAAEITGFSLGRPQTNR